VIHLDNVDKNEIEAKREIIKDLKEELTKVSDNEINYFVFFYNRSKKVNAYKTIISENIGKSIKDKFKDSIESLEPELLYNYDDSDGLNNDNPELINSKEVPFSNEILKAIDDTEDMLSLKELKVASSPKFAIKAGRIIGFDLLKKMSIMKNKRRYMSLNDSSTFDEIDEQVFLEIPDSFSAIYYNDHIIVLKETIFDSIFDYHVRIMEAIRGKEEHNKRLFSDTNSFYNSIQGDSRKARKLYNVYNSSYIGTLTVNDIMDYATEFNLEIYVNPQDEKIDFNKSNAWHVVKAISEDFFTGRWSQDHFESNSKHRISD
jgi:glutaredoxin-related protein